MADSVKRLVVKVETQGQKVAAEAMAEFASGAKSAGNAAGDAEKKINGLKFDKLKASFATMRDVMMGPVEAGKLIGDVVLKIGEKLGSMVAKAAEAERAQSTLKAVFTATGAAAWTSMGQLNDYADAMEASTLFDGKDIAKMQSVLLGFKNITGDVFESASDQILNMSQVMGMDLTSSAQALGKALDDPINGIDSLSRQGFKFADADKAMLKGLIETGQMAKAQKYIIDQLGTTFGNAAQAATQNATGGFQAIRKEFEKISENLGKIIAIKASDFGGLVGLRDALKDTNKSLGAEAGYLEIGKKFQSINGAINSQNLKEGTKAYHDALLTMLPSADEFNTYLGYMLSQRDMYAGNTKKYKEWDEKYYNAKLAWEKEIAAVEKERTSKALSGAGATTSPISGDLEKIIKKYKDTIAENKTASDLGIMTQADKVKADEDALKQEVDALNDLYQTSNKSALVFGVLKKAAEEYADVVEAANKKDMAEGSAKSFASGNKDYASRIEAERDAKIEAAKLSGASGEEQLAIFDKYNKRELDILKAYGGDALSFETESAKKRIQIIKDANKVDFGKIENKGNKDLEQAKSQGKSIEEQLAIFDKYHAIELEIVKANGEDINAFEEQSAEKRIQIIKESSAAEIKALDDAQKKNPLVSSGLLPTLNYSTDESGNTYQSGSSGGTEMGQMAMGVFDPLAAALQSLISDMMKLESVSKILNPIGTAIDAFMGVVGPVIDKAFKPMAGIIKIIGEAAGKILVPILELLIPLVEIFAQVLIGIYNVVIVPLGNKLITTFVAIANVIGPILIGIYNAFELIFRTIYNNVTIPMVDSVVRGYAFMANAVIRVINSMIDSINSVLSKLGINQIARLDEVSSKSGLTALASDQKTWTTMSPSDYLLSGITVSDLETTSDELESINATLKENKELFSKASNAASAYSAVLEKVKSAASSFYDSLKDMGTKIASTLIDALTNGFDNDDFLYTMEEYIRSQVIQAVVYTDTMQTAVARIGTQISQAIAGGTLDSTTMSSIKDQLSSLLATAQSSFNAVQSVFGYDVGSLNIRGDQLANIHNGEMILPQGIASEARSAGVYIGPMSGSSAAGGSTNVVANIPIVLDGNKIASATLKYIDNQMAVAYGT